MATNIKEALLDCEKIISDIMDKVDSRLSENGITFIHNNQSEIIIENKTKKEITDILSNLEDIDESQSKLLLQITESNNKVFIRQKFN